METSGNQSHPSHARATSEVVRRVQAVASRARLIRVVAAVSSFVSALLAVLLVEGALDAVLRFPSFLRAAIALGIITLVVALMRRTVRSRSARSRTPPSAPAAWPSWESCGIDRR
jgi:ABC-type branched-subunit amino acid transport system permease subunit